MVEQGYLNREIAEVLGLRSERQVTRLRRQAGLDNPNGEAPSPEVLAEIRRLSEEEGWPPEEISRTLGCSYNAAREHSVRGPGEDWSRISARLARKHRSLWDELRNKG